MMNDQTSDLPQITWTSAPANPSLSLGSFGGLQAGQIVSTTGTSHDPALYQRWMNRLTTAVSTNQIHPTRTEEGPPMAKLIRYTVVNPDRHLAEVAPEEAILLTGQKLMRGDERGFLLGLALDLKAPLDKHNEALQAFTYEDAEGKPRPFKPVRMSQLDVVVETVREYK